MTVYRQIWVGTDANEGPDPEGIWRIQRPGPAGDWDGVDVVRTIAASRATYLTLHPSADRLYAVSEQDGGRVISYAFGADCTLGQVRSVATGGSGPCHLRVHPQGRWLYVANYGDGVLSAVELTEAGDVSDHVLTFGHAGTGPNPDRQEGPHAHSTRISPGGGYLLVADLGTDEIRAYPLESGRPDPDPVITSLPAGSGPRHVAGSGRYLYISGELSGEVLVLEWDENTGRGEVVQQVRAATLPGRSEDAYYLSHILFSSGVVLVASRGSDSVSTFTVHDDGARLELAGEVHTGAWPRHMALSGPNLLVAGEREDRVLIHPFTPRGDPEGRYQGAVGPVQHEIEIPRPMFILPM
ncbi:lactonase family protein [Pseudactinotalea sp. Z1739]|uniref:lactonase family protein n=1 Tax=Pseudactinotalea sp. Z1739 TaxID=3413028 RepID=UPI003C7E5B79